MAVTFNLSFDTELAVRPWTYTATDPDYVEACHGDADTLEEAIFQTGAAMEARLEDGATGEVTLARHLSVTDLVRVLESVISTTADTDDDNDDDGLCRA